MKRRKLMKRLTAFVMTAVMTMGMGTNVFALPDEPKTSELSTGVEEAPATETSKKYTTIDIKKILKTTDSNVYAPNTPFQFTICAGEAGSYGELKYTPGTLEAVSVDNSAFVYTAESKRDEKSGDFEIKSPAVKIDANKFSGTGIYSYQVSEQVPDAVCDGMSYDTEKKYDLLLFVMTDDSNHRYVGAVSAKLTSDENWTKQPDLSFESTYTTKDLTVTKLVTGNMGEKNKDFSFTIILKGASGERYKVVKLNASGEEIKDETLKDVESGAELPVSLQHGQSVKISGLSENDTYTVVENFNYEAEGYKEPQGQVKDPVAVTENGAKVIVTNEKDVPPATGIIMTFGPYVLLIGLAGVLAFVFLRKKRNGQDNEF